MKKSVLVFIAAIMTIAFALSSCAPKSASVTDRQKAQSIRELGEAYLAEGNYTMALRELRRAKEINPDDPFLHNSLGLTYMARGRHETALSHFKEAVALNPDYSPARNNLGSAYIALEQWDKAIECFETVKEDLLYATPYYAASNLGYIYYRKGQLETARFHYREALEMRRRFPRALHGLGLVALAAGNTDEAIGHFEQAIEELPEAAYLHMDLARAYEQKHQYDKALEIYEKAASLARDSRLGDEAEEAMRAIRDRW